MENKAMQRNSPNVHIRTMTKDDFPEVLDIFEQAGSILGLDSLNSWFDMDPEGWKVAVNSTEEIVGVCSATQLTDDFYCLKNYAVKEKYRGMGIGLKVWNACMGYIGHRAACLRCELGMVKNYKSSGFSFVDTDTLNYYESHHEIQQENLSSELPEGISIVPFKDSYLKSIFEYDPFCCTNNAKRQRIIELNCKEKYTKTLVAFKAGACVGFGTMKITSSGSLILMPMYADNAEIAEAMLKKLIQFFPGNKGISVRAFSANTAVDQIMKKLDCYKTNNLYHMYTRMDPSLFKFKSSMHKLFALLKFDILDF